MKNQKTDQNPQDSRRGFLKKIVYGAGGVGILSASAKANPTPAGPILPEIPAEDISFHFVHLTDMHVRRQRRGHVGYAACIASVNALETKPDLVLMGGDMAFDGLYNEKSDFEDMITLYKEASDKLEMPYYNCIGNHDVLGLSSRRKVSVDDPDIGKKMIMDKLGMEKSYYSFNHNGWHFVVLDTIFEVDTPSGPSYAARLGEEQLDWLRFDLGAHKNMPTVCVMHIAAFCNMGQINGDTEALAMNHMVIRDNLELRQILERHGVKAVLQGHSHQIEDFYFNGVWYITSQSVSAAWWGGNWRGFNPGYTVFTAGKDGRLSWKRQEFEWEHHLEPEDELERARIVERKDFVSQQKALYELEIGKTGKP